MSKISDIVYRETYRYMEDKTNKQPKQTEPVIITISKTEVYILMEMIIKEIHEYLADLYLEQRSPK